MHTSAPVYLIHVFSNIQTKTGPVNEALYLGTENTFAGLVLHFEVIKILSYA